MVLVAADALAELSRRAKEELAKRRRTPAFKAAVIAALRAELFAEQIAVLDDPSPRIAMCCSRRAGKSEVAARMLAIALIEAKHNEYVMFAARTLLRARQIIFGLMEKINDDYGLGWRMSAHLGQIVTEDGGCFMLLGVDDANSTEKVRGSKYRLAFLDESATYEALLERLVVDCLEPGTIDMKPRGRIVLAGTPGYNKTGYWFAVASGAKPGWSSHYWTLRTNPHIPDVEASLKSIRDANSWSEDEPVYLREYCGLWTSDESTLVYAANDKRNTCRLEDLPTPPPGMSFEAWVKELWLTTVSADIGYTDAFAVAVLGSPPHSRDIFILETFKHVGLLAPEQAEHIGRFRTKYRPLRTVIDAGGQGKLVQAEFNQRYASTMGGPAIPAKKMGKVEAIGQMNSDLRLGRIKALLPAAADLFKEWVELPWADDDKTLIHPSYKNHVSDAVLYGWREHRSFMAKNAPPAETEETRERERLEARMRAAKKRK